MKKKMLTLLIVPILLMATVLGAYGQQTVPAEDGVTVDELLDLFDNAKDTVSNVLDTVEGRGVTVPQQVWDNYDAGLAKAEEAVQLRNEGNSEAAKAKALEAMQDLKTALLAVAGDFESVQTPEEIEAQKAAAIEEATDRIQSAIERLENIADKAKAQGLDVGAIEDKLVEAQALLADIKEKIGAGDVSGAEQGVAMSQQAFGEAMAELRPVIAANVANQAEGYLDSAEARIASISNMITTIIDDLPIPPQAKDLVTQNVGQRIQTAQNKIAQARSLLQEGSVSEALPLLDGLRADISNIIAQVEQQTPGTGVALENIDRHEAVIGVLEDTAETLSERGVDVSALLEKIEDAKDQLQGAVESLKSGDLTAVDEILGQVDDIVEEAKALVEQLVNQG